MVSIPILALVIGLFLQLGGVLVTLGMLIKTVRLLEKAQERTEERLEVVAGHLVKHQLTDDAHPFLRGKIETATALAQSALSAARGGQP